MADAKPITWRAATRRAHGRKRRTLTSATAAPNREPAFRQSCPHCQRRCSEYGEPTDPKINICARRLSSPHKQLVEQNAVGNGGFSIRFRRRGLPHSGSSCCHLAEPDRKDNCGDRTSSDREPTI